MRRFDSGKTATLVDLPAAAHVSAPRTIGQGYRSYQKHEIALPGGSATTGIERDVLRSGRVVGVLPIDLRRDEVVLMRQFRLGGHIALDDGRESQTHSDRRCSGGNASLVAARNCR
jgi:ADP-ribose diphosphatase